MLPLGRKRGDEDSSGAGPRVNVVGGGMLVAPSGLGMVGIVVGLVLMQAPKVAKQWERGVVLRLGRYVGLRGPGLFWVMPFVDSVNRWIDQRVITTSFAAEQTLTSDTVPVNVDAVLFWLVYDPEKAALEVQEYVKAVSWAADRAARHHRPDVAHRSPQRTRADRRGAAAAHRPPIESVGRDGAVRRNARRGDPRLAAGRDV